MEKSEQELFLEGIKSESQASFPEGEMTSEEVKPESEQQVSQEEEQEVRGKNRRERRLYEKLEAERKASAQLAEKLSLISEAQKARGGEEAEYLSMLDRIYGTDSPEAREATEVLKESLRRLQEEATQRALDKIREEREMESREEAEAEEELETILDEIEETYDVDMTDDETRTQYLKLLERMSPKDREGNILQFADHHAVWEVFQSRNAGAQNRAKDLASRSLVQSGQGGISSVQQDATERWLRENGII